MSKVIELSSPVFSATDKIYLYDRIEQVLDFAISNINQIDLSLEDWNETIGPHICFADKVIIETSLLALIVKRTAGETGQFEKQLHILAKALCPHVRSEKNSITLMRVPQSAAVFGIGHIALCALGFPDEHFDHLIKRAFRSKEVFNTERLPYRKMDVLWLHNLIFPGSPIALDDVLQHTILMSTAHPIYMTVPDIYALTHSLMYITDFGSTSVPSSVNMPYISAVINSACSYHLFSDNLDVLGELIIANTLMQITWSPHVELGWTLLTGIWDKLGFLPCPTFESGAFASLQEKAASSYAFRHLYHTTYVGGILCCLLINCNNTENPANRDFSPGEYGINTNNLLSRISDCINQADRFSAGNSTLTARIPHDYSLERKFDFIKSSIQERFTGRGSAKFILSLINTDPSFKNETVLSILTDALLIYAIQEYDLPFVAQILFFITGFKIPLTLTVCKSIEFVLDQQLPSGAIGGYALQDNIAPGNTAEISYCLTKLSGYINEYYAVT